MKIYSINFKSARIDVPLLFMEYWISCAEVQLRVVIVGDSSIIFSSGELPVIYGKLN